MGGAVLREGWAFKLTGSAHVVLRRIELYRKGMFLTFHDEAKDPNSRKSYFIERRCELDPAHASSICELETKLIRPSGTWAITSYARKGRGEQVQLVRCNAASHIRATSSSPQPRTRSTRSP